jgi:hypothetical protein
LEQRQEDLKAAGLQLLAVGLGESKHAERYCGKLAPSQTCFAATTNDPYYEWGLYQFTARDMLANGLKLVVATQKARSNGQTQGEATGDIAMSSGTFIVDTAGIVRYTYYGKYAGDDPDIDELLNAARALKAGV